MPYPPEPDPTEEEILKRAAEIRAAWTDAERRRHDSCNNVAFMNRRVRSGKKKAVAERRKGQIAARCV